MPTITNAKPLDYLFTLPVFYRVQAHFRHSNEIHMFDYMNRESLERIPETNKVAGFKIHPIDPALSNDIYERSSY